MNNLLQSIKLRDDNLKCDKCYLRNINSKPVCSLNNSSRIFVVGHHPGSDEDLTSEPFSGREGQFIKKFMSELFNKNSIHYTYLVKCFSEQSIKQKCRMLCANLWLTKEIELADPDIIICCSSPVFKILTGKKHSEIPCETECQSRSIILIDGVQKLNKKSIYTKNLVFIKKALGL